MGASCVRAGQDLIEYDNLSAGNEEDVEHFKTYVESTAPEPIDSAETSSTLRPDVTTGTAPPSLNTSLHNKFPPITHTAHFQNAGSNVPAYWHIARSLTLSIVSQLFH